MSNITNDPDETSDINQLIDDVVPDANIWRNTPNPLLGNKTPNDLIGTDQELIIRDMVRAAKHGMFS